jgi:hypothetical protein
MGEYLVGEGLSRRRLGEGGLPNVQDGFAERLIFLTGVACYAVGLAEPRPACC